jgi:hypothetical protein
MHQTYQHPISFYQILHCRFDFSIDLIYFSTEEMMANIFTKPFLVAKISKFAHSLGLLLV